MPYLYDEGDCKIHAEEIDRMRLDLVDIKATLIALLICVPFCMLLSVWLISGMIK